jgi:hypothetical protein
VSLERLQAIRLEGLRSKHLMYNEQTIFFEWGQFFLP